MIAFFILTEIIPSRVRACKRRGVAFAAARRAASMSRPSPPATIRPDPLRRPRGTLPDASGAGGPGNGSWAWPTFRSWSARRPRAGGREPQPARRLGPPDPSLRVPTLAPTLGASPPDGSGSPPVEDFVHEVGGRFGGWNSFPNARKRRRPRARNGTTRWPR